MNFGFTEEQELLRTQVRRFLNERSPLSRTRELAKGDEGICRETWQEMAGLGWLGLTVPESFGGSDLSWIDLTVVLEELGRSLHPSPYVSTTLAACALLRHGSDAQKSEWLPTISDGTCVPTLALFDAANAFGIEAISLQAERDNGDLVLRGCKRFVADAAAADIFLVAFRDTEAHLTLAIVPATQPGVSVVNCSNLDRTKPSGSLRLEGVRIEADAVLGDGPIGTAALEGLLDLGALAASAESIGVCEAILEMTTEYAKQRVQVGSPIGRYQGVKHPLADIYVDIECMKSLTYYAAWAVTNRRDDAALAVSRAK
ncbi:MAG: acyl-CoA dehydrogenase family protein, partial [Halioglobus sp.]|nr:acyl-CoA dehydrogenase family protein [Halioglobus sp.]